MIIKRYILAALIALFATSALAKAPQFAPAPPPRPSIPVFTGEELAAAAGISGEIAFVVVDLDAETVLEARSGDIPLPPASVAKVPTALFALDVLGPDYRFETSLVSSSQVSGGVLSGDLVLRGGGDPEMDTRTLDALVRSASGVGLRQVSGAFLVDDSFYPRIERIDRTQPEYAAYNPAVGGLNLNYNRVHAEWKRGSNGYSMKVEARAEGLSPPTDIARVRIVETTSNGGVFDYEMGSTAEHWSVARRALGKRGARWLPVRRPATYAGRTFRTLARQAGMVLPAEASGEAPIDANTLVKAESRPLSEILRDMLRYSTNLTAEAVGLAAARSRGAAPRNLGASANAMNAWASGFVGFQPGATGFQLTNHSGLSGEARASARLLTALLVAADKRVFPARSGGFPASLRELMPEKRYLDDDKPAPQIAATLRAKTGTLNFASALAGYIDTESGRRLAFAIVTADLAKRAAIRNQQVERPRGSRTWGGRSRRLQRALVRSWISRFGG